MKKLLQNKSNKLYNLFLQNKIKSIFYISMTISIGLYFFLLFISKGNIGKTILYNDTNDTFMDFFNVIYMNYGMDPIPKNIYPPFAALLMLPFYGVIPREIVSHGSVAIRSNQAGLFSLMIFIIIAIFSLFIIMDSFKKGNNFEKKLFMGIMLLSAPFLFQFERQNLIIFALIFLIGFLLLKDSNNKWLREISLVFLAFSACIKVYPAIFGLLLLKEKRYKDAIKSIIYGILVFVLPFFVFGGLSKFIPLIKNIVYTNNEFFLRGFGYKVDLINFFRIIGNYLGLNDALLIQFFSKGVYILLIISIPVFFKIKSDWKSIALLTCIIVATPSFSYVYSLVYFIIPVSIFLDKKENNNILDYIYLIMFILIFNPLSGIVLDNESELILTVDMFLRNFAVVAIYLMIVVEGYFSIIKNIVVDKKLKRTM